MGFVLEAVLLSDFQDHGEAAVSVSHNQRFVLEEVHGVLHFADVLSRDIHSAVEVDGDDVDPEPSD